MSAENVCVSSKFAEIFNLRRNAAYPNIYPNISRVFCLARYIFIKLSGDGSDNKSSEFVRFAGDGTAKRQSPYQALLRVNGTAAGPRDDQKTASIRSYPKRLSPTFLSDDFYSNARGDFQLLCCHSCYPPRRWRSIALSLSVCVFVCLLICLPASIPPEIHVRSS